MEGKQMEAAEVKLAKQHEELRAAQEDASKRTSALREVQQAKWAEEKRVGGAGLFHVHVE
eukprot:340147-Pyramimonas_sp.AAC.1